MIDISIPARSNMPPLLPKSFCMSMTITAVFEISIAIGSGFALIVTILLFMGRKKSDDVFAGLNTDPFAIPTSDDIAIAASIWRRDSSCVFFFISFSSTVRPL